MMCNSNKFGALDSGSLGIVFGELIPVLDRFQLVMYLLFERKMIRNDFLGGRITFAYRRSLATVYDQIDS